MHMSMAVRKRPGMRMIHHDFVISALSAFESMLPHEICSSGRPIPMKLKVDSAMIALLIFMTTINMIDEAKLGVRCFHTFGSNFSFQIYPCLFHANKGCANDGFNYFIFSGFETDISPYFGRRFQMSIASQKRC